MSRSEPKDQTQVNWDAVLTLMAILAFSSGIWGAAIGALMAFVR